MYFLFYFNIFFLFSVMLYYFCYTQTFSLSLLYCCCSYCTCHFVRSLMAFVYHEIERLLTYLLTYIRNKNGVSASTTPTRISHDHHHWSIMVLCKALTPLMQRSNALSCSIVVSVARNNELSMLLRPAGDNPHHR